jgi:Rv0078B-related antitoxin
MYGLDPEDVKALRAMSMEERLKRGLDFMEQARQLKIASERVHHPGWSEEKVMDEVRRWVRDGMKPGELYEV